MTHYGNLENQDVSAGVHDVRGTTVLGSNGEEIGTVQDVIFNHDTMEIHYVVVDSGGWLEGDTFLLPADRVSVDEDHEDGLAAAVSRQQIENSPRDDNKSTRREDEWKKFEQEFKKYWDEKPVLHMKDSHHIIVPPEASLPEQGSSVSSPQATGDRELNAAQLFPERISDVFSDPAPSSGKVTLRPRSVARAEEAASGVALLKPRWWEAFENYLQVNKDDIKSKCSQCTSKAA